MSAEPSGTEPASVEATESEAQRPRSRGHDIVVIGASAGGLDALRRLVATLPADLPAALFVVVHISPEADSMLPSILSRAGALPAVAAEEGMPIERGRIYVAPPDRHLLLERDVMRVTRGPRENRHRPAADPLFRSAAWSHGPAVVGVVLSGNLDDGTAGLWAVKSCGGTTVVQDPGDAEHPDMPSNALLHNRIDHRLPVAEIGELIVRLAREPIGPEARREPPPYLPKEIAFATFDKVEPAIQHGSALGELTPYTCPSCRGALWELDEGGHLRYRCHTGHAYSHAALVLEQTIAIEEGLFTALRSVEEKAEALRRLAARWPDRIPGIKEDYEKRALALDSSAEVIRQLLAGEPR